MKIATAAMEGYPKLASFMGNARTSGHFLIFQKFESLSAQNLLYLQAEIINLQDELNDIANADLCSDNEDRQLYTRDWCTLSSSEDKVQWQKWLEIRAKIKEYYEAIAQLAMVTNLPKPNRHDLNFLQNWLQRPSMGGCKLVGADRNVYKNAEGLATLAPKSGETDVLTRVMLFKLPALIHSSIITPFHKISGFWLKKPMDQHLSSVSTRETEIGSTALQTITLTSSNPDRPGSHDMSTPPLPEPFPSSQTNSTLALQSSTERVSQHLQSPKRPDIEAQIFIYSDSSLYTLATVISTTICALIPIAAIVVLYWVTYMPARLGVVTLFTVVFAVCLSLVTEARRVEVFAATAAFASVQVVFVGSTTWS